MGKDQICATCSLSFIRPRALQRHRCPQKPIPPLMSLQQKTPPPVDDGWEDEPLCSVDASLGPESGPPAAGAPSADTPREPVTGQPSMTPATISSADTTPIFPWTPDQAGPATPTVLQEVVDQGPPYSPLPPTELHTLPELVRDRDRATRLAVPYDELSTVPRESDAADTALSGTERHYRDCGTNATFFSSDRSSEGSG